MSTFSANFAFLGELFLRINKVEQCYLKWEHIAYRLFINKNKMQKCKKDVCNITHAVSPSYRAYNKKSEMLCL